MPDQYVMPCEWEAQPGLLFFGNVTITMDDPDTGSTAYHLEFVAGPPVDSRPRVRIKGPSLTPEQLAAILLGPERNTDGPH